MIRRLALGLIAALSLTPATAEPAFESVLTPKRGCLHAQKPCLPLIVYCHGSCYDTMRSKSLGAFDSVSLYVSGRLSGGPEKRYKLEAIGSAFADAMAYLGRSIRNRPIVDTVQGDFEISTIGIDVLPDAHVIAMDGTSGEVLARYIVDRIVFSKSGKAGRWDEIQQKCISAPQYKPGLLRDLTKDCPPAVGPSNVYIRVGGAVVELPGAHRARFKVKGYGTYVATYRVPSANLTIALRKSSAE